MSVYSFINRQFRKLRKRTVSSRADRLIIEHNANGKKILNDGNNFTISNLNLTLPKKSFEFILQYYILFNSIRNELKGVYIFENNNLQFSFGNIKLNITSISDMIVIDEIFCRNCYNFRLTKEEATVIDVGMNTGIASVFFAALPEVKEVFSFEPFKESFERAERNFELNPTLAKKIHREQIALGKADEEMFCAFDAENSVLNKTTAINTQSDDKELIVIKDAKKIFDKIFEKTGRNIVIKMDCEGAEFEIFERAFSQGIHESVKMFLVEWHEREPAYLEKILNKNSFNTIRTSIKPGVGMIYAVR